jgi:filamentous hemagglutinin
MCIFSRPDPAPWLGFTPGIDVVAGVYADAGASGGIAGDYPGPITLNLGLGKYMGIQLNLSNAAASTQLPWYDPSRYVNTISGGIGVGLPVSPAIPFSVSIDPVYIYQNATKSTSNQQ